LVKQDEIVSSWYDNLNTMLYGLKQTYKVFKKSLRFLNESIEILLSKGSDDQMTKLFC